jgi:hypothetical protein
LQKRNSTISATLETWKIVVGAVGLVVTTVVRAELLYCCKITREFTCEYTGVML